MRAPLRSKGHFLTPALKEIRRTKAVRLLQWHAENGHEKFLSTDEKFSTIEEQYSNQKKRVMLRSPLEVHSEGAWMPSPFLRHGLVGGVPTGGDTSSFLQERGEAGARVYQEDVLQGFVKQLNMTLFSGQELSSSRINSCPKGKNDSAVAAEERSSLYQRWGLALGESRP